MTPTLWSLFQTSEPAALGASSRTGALPQAELEKQLAAATQEPLARAVVLLWHDHLEAAHLLAQAVEGRDGSYVHGLMHRREPDYGNAKYWLRRVGRHPTHPLLATRVAALLAAAKADGAELEAQLLPAGAWEPFGFVDLCEAEAGSRSGKSPAAAGRTRLLREIQRIEFELLLDHLAGPPPGKPVT